MQALFADDSDEHHTLKSAAINTREAFGHHEKKTRAQYQGHVDMTFC